MPEYAVDESADEPVGFANEGEPRSPFAQPSITDLLRQEAQNLAESKTVDIPIKGFEQTGLRARYHLPESGKELDNIARKVFREFKDTYSRNLYITTDTMAYLCDGLYVMPVDMAVDEPVELDPELTGAPITFDVTLAQVLGGVSEPVTARKVIRKLFGNNEMAILAHGEKLNRWLQDTSVDLSTELWQMQGES